MGKLRIVIADDQTLFREGLQTILNLEEDMEVIDTANNGQEAVQLVERLQPDIVLMDVEMPVMNGIESTRLIKERVPDTHVLILTTFAEDDYIVEGLMYGAGGYLLKDLHADTLIANIRSAASGQLMLPAPVAAKLAARLHGCGAPARRGKPSLPLEELTEREKEIAALMLRGYNNREIANRLFMSEGTVRNYISVLYSKIGTNDRSKAIVLFRDMFL
jgi:DNA-binding NarL/FixJ family response regulator